MFKPSSNRCVFTLTNPIKSIVFLLCFRFFLCFGLVWKLLWFWFYWKFCSDPQLLSVKRVDVHCASLGSVLVGVWLDGHGSPDGPMFWPKILFPLHQLPQHNPRVSHLFQFQAWILRGFSFPIAAIQSDSRFFRGFQCLWANWQLCILFVFDCFALDWDVEFRLIVELKSWVVSKISISLLLLVWNFFSSFFFLFFFFFVDKMLVWNF